MTDAGLQAEQLTLPPQRLETITLKGGSISQKAVIDQSNFSAQIGGNCLLASCDQTSVQVNAAEIDQNARSTTDVRNVLEDNRRFFLWR
jgi:hypothetical protein